MTTDSKLIDFANAEMLFGGGRSSLRRAQAVYDNDQRLFVAVLDALCLGQLGEFATVDELCADAGAVAVVARTQKAWRLLLGTIIADPDSLASIVGDENSMGQIAASSGALDMMFADENASAAMAKSGVACAAIAQHFAGCVEETPWKRLKEIAALVNEDNADSFSPLLGKSKTVALGQYGVFGFSIVGLAQKAKYTGGMTGLTWMCDNIITSRQMYTVTSSPTGYWQNSLVRTGMTTLFSSLQSSFSNFVELVENYQQGSRSGDYLWIPSVTELGIAGGANESDAKFQLVSKVKTYTNGTAASWWTRSIGSNDLAYQITVKGGASTTNANSSLGVVPCFCI